MSVIYHQSKKIILLVDKSYVKSIENPKTTLPFSDIYIGGAPSSVLESRYINRTDLKNHLYEVIQPGDKPQTPRDCRTAFRQSIDCIPRVCSIAGLNYQQSLV